MSATEHWLCDICEEANAYEDDARENGWVVLERYDYRSTVLPAIPGTDIPERTLSPYTHHDVRHICAGCLDMSAEAVVRRFPDWHGWKPMLDEYNDAWTKAKEKAERALDC